MHNFYIHKSSIDIASQFIKHCWFLILAFMIVSSKLATSEPAEFKTKSSVGELFPYYINDGTDNNPHYVYITDEHALYNGKKLITSKIIIRNLFRLMEL